MLRHQFEKIEETGDVVAIVEKRFLHTLAYSLACCKMYDSLDVRILIKNALHCRIVATIHLLKSGSNACNLFYTVNYVCIGIAKIVNDDYLISSIDKFNGGVRTDKTGATCYEYCMFHKLFI